MFRGRGDYEFSLKIEGEYGFPYRIPGHDMSDRDVDIVDILSKSAHFSLYILDFI